MPSNDNTSTRHHGQALDYLPVHIPRQPRKTTLLTKARAAARKWWNDAWDIDGVLYTMWDDILSAPDDGFRYMARWLRTVLALAVLSFVVLLANAAGAVILQALHQLLTAVPKVQVGVDTSSGVFAVVDQPVRTYIAQHAAGLPVAASTVYTLWQLTGIAALVLGWLTRNNGVRATWIAWSAATVWMVWTATPHTSRTVAAGLAVLAWTLLSAFALRGLTLRRRVIYPARPARAAVRPEPHVPPHPAGDDFGGETRNAHPSQQR